MQNLLIYFTEDAIEFWSIDRNNRLIELPIGASNILPLYFMAKGYEISMGTFPKEEYEKGEKDTFGDFWSKTISSKSKFKRNGENFPINSILYYALKENIIPEILRENYDSINFEEFQNKYKTILIFDSFISNTNIDLIIEGFTEICGYNADNILSYNYWEIFKKYYQENNILEEKDNLLSLSTDNSNVTLQYVLADFNDNTKKKILKNYGIDPRLSALSNYLVEQLKKRGCILDDDKIKDLIKKDLYPILAKLNNGLVEHTFQIPQLGIFPPNNRISFHRDVVINSINNKDSMLFIQSELAAFIEKNKASNVKIFLLGSILNQPIFVHFFQEHYKNIIESPQDFEKNFKLFSLTNLSKFKNILESDNKPDDFDDEPIVDEINSPGLSEGPDPLLEEAAILVVTHQQGSASLIQRKLRTGYNRAGRIIDQLEAAGIIGQFDGSKAREVKCKNIEELNKILFPNNTKSSETPKPLVAETLTPEPQKPEFPKNTKSPAPPKPPVGPPPPPPQKTKNPIPVNEGPETKPSSLPKIIFGIIVIVVLGWFYYEFFGGKNKLNEPSEMEKALAMQRAQDSIQRVQDSLNKPVDEYESFLAGKYITSDQTKNLSLEELTNYKNEFLARHNYNFSDNSNLRSYYSNMPWYEGNKNYLMATSSFSEIENYNFNLIEKEINNYYNIVGNLIRSYFDAKKAKTFDANDFFDTNVDQYVSFKNITPDKINEENGVDQAEFINPLISFQDPISITFIETKNAINYFTFPYEFMVYRVGRSKIQTCEVICKWGITKDYKLKHYEELNINNLQFNEPSDPQFETYMQEVNQDPIFN
jgi:hypothetical protein